MRFGNLTKIMGLLLVTILFGSGCVERLGDIDKTRPNVVKKSTLSGEWYFRQMVTDIPYLGAVSAPSIIGSATGLYRVRWEVQEKFLLAISQDELSPGKNDYDPGENPEEQIVGKFTILSHFDVRRQYDEQTGEENNVVYEDSTSQKWYEFSQMRVDWSRNLAGNSLNFSLSPESNHVVQVESVGDDDPYLIDIADDHITVTSKHAVGYNYNGRSIASSLVTVLTSMLKINPDHDYEPVEYPAQVKQRNADGSIRIVNGQPVFVDVFSRYGFFQTVVQEYDRYDGEIWNTRNYRINRFNMWERTFGANGQPIPIQNRTLKPILYFVAEDYPREMMPAAERIGELWNQAFKKALEDVNYPVNSATVAFAVCDNPVTAQSPAHCRATGEGLKLFGDLRYNFLKLARPAGTVNPLGYGPSSQDVRTGETINGWAVTYYSGLNSSAKRALDMVKMYNGEIDAESVEWIEGDYYEGLQHSMERSFGDSHGHRSEEMHAAMAEMSQKAKDLMRTPEFKAQDKLLQENLFSGLQGQTLSQKIASQMGSSNELLSELDDAAFEGFLDNQAESAETTSLLEALRADTTSTINGQILERDEIITRLSEHNVYLQEFADPTIAYIAARIAKKYPYPAQGVANRAQLVLENDAKIISELRMAIYVGVMLHEVGHNLGLRHNFSGSTDEMNYIQPGVTTPVVPGDISVSDDANANEGYWDIATTTNDQSQRLEYQYSSIMDYGAGFASDLHGLGAYDIAAIRFGYLNHIEVYDNSHPLFQQSPQGQYQVIQNRSYYEWDPNNVLVDNNGLEVYQTNNGQFYINKHEFCTDTFADGFNLSCSRWDVGSDPIEIGFLYGERLRETYWFSNFARGKVGAGWGFNGGLISGIFSRYFNFAARAGILASYISEIYGVNPNEALQGNMAYYHIVAGIGLNEVMNTLMTPDTGCYEWEDRGVTPTLMRSGTCDVRINNHDGAHPRYSHYTMTKEEYSSVSRFGFFNNKIGALLALFRGFGINLEQFAAGEINNRYSSLSLANAFKAETVELLKALMTDGPSRYNALPVQNASGTTLNVASAGQQVARVVASDRVLLDVGQALQDPGLTQSLEDTVRPFGNWELTPKIESNRSDYEFQYGFLYAMMTLRSLYDRTWNNYLSLNQQGDQWGHDFADPSRVVNWTDDGTGIIWQAYTFDPVISTDGREVDPSVAASFLQFIKSELDEYDNLIAGNPGQADTLEANRRYFLEEVRYRLDFLYNLQNF